MRGWLSIFLLLLLFSCRENQTTAPKQYLIQSVNVVPMDTNLILENYDVLVGQGSVLKLGPGGSIHGGKNMTIIDGRGKFLIPGLAEMHAHVPPVEDLEPMKKVLTLFMVNGVTTIRGMLGHPKHLQLKKMILSGEIIGPRFFTAGPPLNGNTVTSPETAENLVREEKKAGYDFLKILPGISLENFIVIVRTAHEVQIPFAGHVPFEVGIWRAIDAGYATIDHLDGFVESLVPGMDKISEEEAGLFGIYIADKVDEAGISRLMTALRDKNIQVIPTQCLAEKWFNPDVDAETLLKQPEIKYMDSATTNGWFNAKKEFTSNPKYHAAAARKLIEVRRKLILSCQQSGVGLLLGSDAPQVFDVPGFSAHDELKFLVRAGLSPFEALQTGTTNVGRFYRDSRLGNIKEGSYSDLVLLNGNPLADINNVDQIEGVVLGENWLDRNYLDSTLNNLTK